MNKLIAAALLMTATALATSAAVLDDKDTALAKIGAAVARGDQDALAAAFGEGFEVGLTLDEAKEVVGQLYAYCGFPRALNAAATLMQTAKDKGRAERVEREDSLHDSTRSPRLEENSGLLGDKALAVGTANQTALCGGPVAGPLFDFHPQLDAYLKAHLFGDIFARDVLDWRTRELVTVAALAARPETAPQCAAHVKIANLNGVTPEQTDAILALVRRPADPAALPADWSPIPVGKPNDAYAKFFTGRSFLHQWELIPLTKVRHLTIMVLFENETEPRTSSFAGARARGPLDRRRTGGGGPEGPRAVPRRRVRTPFSKG